MGQGLVEGQWRCADALPYGAWEGDGPSSSLSIQYVALSRVGHHQGAIQVSGTMDRQELMRAIDGLYAVFGTYGELRLRPQADCAEDRAKIEDVRRHLLETQFDALTAK